MAHNTVRFVNSRGQFAVSCRVCIAAGADRKEGSSGGELGSGNKQTGGHVGHCGGHL